MKIKYLIILSLFFFCYIKYSQQGNLRNLADGQCYGISIDAGSSGNKVNVYPYPCSQYSKQIQFDVTQKKDNCGDKCNKKLADFNAYDDTQLPIQLNAYFTDVFTWIDTIVPAEMSKMTPIVLGATAGMRVLPLDRQQRIINAVIDIFSKSKYLFPTDTNMQKQWCKVLDGKEEGAFLWITFNLNKNKLVALNNNNKNTVATIDIGGASTQIAFIPIEPDDPTQKKDFNFDIQIKRFNYWHIYTVSYLYYGNDESRRRILAKGKITLDTNVVAPDALAQNFVESPCFPSGYDMSAFTIQDQEIVIKDDGTTFNAFVKGAPDFNACSKLINDYLKGSTQCQFANKKQCAVLNKYQSLIPDYTELYGTSLFVYTSQYLGIVPMNTSTGSFTLKTYYEKLTAAYNRSWEEVKTLYASDTKMVEKKYINQRNLLYGATYVYNLLKNGYNIDENRIINFDKNSNWDQTNLMQRLSFLTCDKYSNKCVIPQYQYE